mmetsp:Transcript_29286/g.103319  ORF Transcript_29286/g.103319 Transcript_29286/m.103319 type:complete len:216 (+) Transcript_29286:777-1424(+)
MRVSELESKSSILRRAAVETATRSLRESPATAKAQATFARSRAEKVEMRFGTWRDTASKSCGAGWPAAAKATTNCESCVGVKFARALGSNAASETASKSRGASTCIFEKAQTTSQSCKASYPETSLALADTAAKSAGAAKPTAAKSRTRDTLVLESKSSIAATAAPPKSRKSAGESNCSVAKACTNVCNRAGAQSEMPPSNSAFSRALISSKSRH